MHKTWNRNQTDRSRVNDEVWILVNPILNSYVDMDPQTNQHKKAYNMKLMCREIIDNIFQYTGALTFSLDLEVINNIAHLEIVHNGRIYDYFSETSECKLLKKIKDDLNFTTPHTLTDSPKFKLKLTYSLI